MSNGILIFGGTYEGRILAEALSRSGISAHVFTATSYGGALIQNLPHLTVHSERLDAGGMRQFMEAHAIERVIDATHPYAREVSRNIVQAAQEAGVEYIRVIRMETPFPADETSLPSGESQIADNGACENTHDSRASGQYAFGQTLSRAEKGKTKIAEENAACQTMPDSGALRGAIVNGEMSLHNVSPKETFDERAGGAMGNAGNTLCKNSFRSVTQREKQRKESFSRDLSGGVSSSLFPSLAGGQKFHTGITSVADTAGAVAYLASTRGPVLVTTGSKELDAFCALPDFAERLYVRVLPMAEVLEHCYALGFSGAHIIAMQGPFGYDLNAALLQHYGCRYLVTKNTGRAGGVEEKIAAALDAGVEVVLIERPVAESGLTLSEVFGLLGLSEHTVEQA